MGRIRFKRMEKKMDKCWQPNTFGNDSKGGREN